MCQRGTELKRNLAKRTMNTCGLHEVRQERSKSVREMWPSLCSNIFSGLRSRYIIPAIEYKCHIKMKITIPERSFNQTNI